MMESSNVFWLRDEKNHPITLVAWSTDGATVRYATATHNPPDKFSRKNAHNKALGRLKQGDPVLVLSIPLDSTAGPEVTIVRHIVTTRRGDVTLPKPPRIWAAATNSLERLISQHATRLERKNKIVPSALAEM
jgi:hypothetical protein